MNLWLSSHFLVAGLFLSSSALSPEECQPLTTPLSLADPAMMYGKTNFMMGYSNNEIHHDILKMTQSMWMKNTPLPACPNVVTMSKWTKINGTCVSSKVHVTIDGNTGSMSYFNSTSAFQILPGFGGFLVFSSQSTLRNVDKMLSLLKLNRNTTVEEFNLRTLYLMGTGETLKDSDLEHFKKQASCLGFSEEPDFIHDTKNGFCAEGEGHKIFGN